MRAAVFVVVVASTTVLAGPQPAPAACDASAQCAAMAAEAIARGEVETAHDLAWRAVQLGPRNDVASMYLLARTQSLSGRAHDALVMLRRLAALGFRPADVETLEDFSRVRSLPGWPDLLASLGELAPSAPAGPGSLGAHGAPGSAPGAPGAPVHRTAPSAPDAPDAPGSAPDRLGSALPVPSSLTAPLALAYDAVSDRFVIADDSSDTLKIIDERTGNALNLVSRGWSGAFRPTALAIDPARGDLWAAGVDTTGDVPQSAIFKLQLVSGRLLQTVTFPKDAGAVRLVDLAVGRRGVFALDAARRRLFAVADGASRARVVAHLVTITNPVGIAVAGETVLYVAHAKGLARVDLTARARLPIAVPASVDVTGLESISWHDGSLFAIQQSGSGAQALRIRLGARGTMATARETLGPAASRAAGVYGGVFYYVAADGDSGGIVLRGTRAR